MSQGYEESIMGIAMNGVIADNVRVKQSATNATENRVTVRIEMHFDGEGEDIRATGDVELSMHFGRYPVPTSFVGYSVDLNNAIARISDMEQRGYYRGLIMQAAIVAAEGNGGHVATMSTRDMDLSE